MANRSYLLNIPARVTDISLLEGEWLGVAGKAWCVPVTWLRLFQPSDLGPCTIDFEKETTTDGKRTSVLGKYLISNPCTSVAAAKENLASSRVLFATLASDPVIGFEYWASAMSALETLPLGFITIDATEVLLMDHVHKGARELAGAFGSDAEAIRCIKEISGFKDGYPPLRLKDYSEAERELRNEAYNNADALDGGFFEPDYFIRSERSAEATRHWLATLASIEYSQ